MDDVIFSIDSIHSMFPVVFPRGECKRKSPTILMGKDEEEIQIHSHDHTKQTAFLSRLWPNPVRTGESFLVVKMFSGADKTAHAAASTRQPPLFTSRQRLPVFATSEATTSFLKMDFIWSQTETAHICEASAPLVSSQGYCDTVPCQTSQRSHRSHTHKQKQKTKNNLTGRPTSTVAESFYCLLD